MNTIKLAILGFGLSLLLGACADNMMGQEEPMMEPAAGPATTPEQPGMGTQEPGMTEGRMGDMMDSDDQEGAGSDQGAGTGTGAGAGTSQ